MNAAKIKCRDLMVGYEWVVGYENLYAISDKGDVYSFRSHIVLAMTWGMFIGMSQMMLI